jgi:C4-dicarboxylate transporter, DctQ subunit
VYRPPCLPPHLRPDATRYPAVTRRAPIHCRLDHFIDRLESSILVWGILALAAIGFIQVFARYLFGYSFTWFEEAGRFAGIFLTFLGAAIGIKSGGHFTMDLVVRRLPPPWQRLFASISTLLSALFFLLVTWYSVKLLLRLHGFGTTSATMGLPMYLVYLPIPFFSLIMALRLLFKLGQTGPSRDQEAAP